MLPPSCDPIIDTEAGLKLVEELTRDASDIQTQVLNLILHRNANTEYLRGFLNSDCGHQHFKSSVPVVKYEDIKPYIQRIANGESSHIISAKPIIELLTSSGTSGVQPKLMPSTAEELNRKTFFYNLLVPVMNKYVKGLDHGKAMYLLFIKPETTTPGGLVARPVLTSYYKSSNFTHRPFNAYNVYTSPDETILCPDSKQSMYSQLLCGLVQRDQVLRVGAVFASAFLRAIRFLEDHWQELCSNIRTGEISDWIKDPSCRSAVSPILDAYRRRQPNLADLIEEECRVKSSWEGIVKRLWPKTKYIEVVVTGSMAQYIPTLEFYSGGLPLVSTMYASSECYFGINLEPLSKPCDVSYTLLPNMAYFEFIPVDQNPQLEVSNGNGIMKNASSNKKVVETVDLVNVKVGNYYELVVTTFTGLYRYRVGDILMVTGFHNKAPKFRFVQRLNVVLSIDTDKTSEEALLKAITEAKRIIEPQGFILTEYTSYADTCSIPGHYVLFWEVIQARSRNAVVHHHVNNNKNDSNNSNNIDDDDDDDLLVAAHVNEPAIMEQCCSTVEQSLDSVYRRCRNKDKSIGPLEIRLVKPGAFDALMDYCLSKGSSVNQYKTPRCIKSVEALRVLDSRVVAKYFSQNVPSWEPPFSAAETIPGSPPLPCNLIN